MTTFLKESVRVLLCSGCTHDPHEPGACRARTFFRKTRCDCTYDRTQVYER